MGAIKPKSQLRLAPGARGASAAPSKALALRIHEPEDMRLGRRHSPTTPLQPLPPIGPATTKKMLTECEDAVLALVTLDPRLGHLYRRDVLRLLSGLLHASFDAPKVGRALRRLREYQQRGWLFTPAFGPVGHDARGHRDRYRDPDPTQARTVMAALLDRYGGHGEPPAGHLAYALRLLGLTQDPSAGVGS